MGVVGSLRTSSNPLFAISSIEWDLPLKRSFALWHAAMNRHARILLLDDDIVGIDAPLFSAGTDALGTSPVAGPFVEDYPDTSVIGHVKIALGDEVLPFLSGSCLFVNCSEPRGFFPQIYNEDWLFMTPYVAIGMVCSLGHVAQMPYDPFANPLLARFQEPGEAIADGLFALLSANRYSDRFDSTVWKSLLSARSQWLKDLAARTALPSHRLALDTALDRFRDIRAKECAQYIRDLDDDRIQWHRQVLEVMK